MDDEWMIVQIQLEKIKEMQVFRISDAQNALTFIHVIKTILQIYPHFYCSLEI